MCAEGRVQAQPRPSGWHSPLDAHGLGALDEGHLALPVHIVCVLLRPRGGAVDDGVHAHQRRRQRGGVGQVGLQRGVPCGGWVQPHGGSSRASRLAAPENTAPASQSVLWQLPPGGPPAPWSPPSRAGSRRGSAAAARCSARRTPRPAPAAPPAAPACRWRPPPGSRSWARACRRSWRRRPPQRCSAPGAQRSPLAAGAVWVTQYVVWVLAQRAHHKQSSPAGPRGRASLPAVPRGLLKAGAAHAP